MRAPGPRGHFLLGSLPAVRRDPLQLLLQSFHDYGEVVRFRFGPMTAHLVSAPAFVQQVLVDRQASYGKNTRGYNNLRYVLGNGLLTAQGEVWKRHRRIAQPAFHKHRIAGFAESMVRAAEDAVSRLEPRRGAEVDLSAEMTRLTLRIVGETLLGHDPTADADSVGSALSFLLHLANERTTRILQLPPTLPTPESRRFQAARRTLDRVVIGMIDERRKQPGDRFDLLSMLMESRDEETGETLDDQQVRDEVMTIFLAGHETTSNALTWTFLLLARYPAALRGIRDELARVLGGRSPTLADLPQLPSVREALQESMRLYPPAWIIARSVETADEIGGYEVPKGSIVFVSPWVVHRNPKVWADPEGFDPQRFSPARAETQPRGAYFPFGGGPRLCIGNGFAMMEAELVLATIAQKLRFELVPGAPVELEPSITLRPRHGIRMMVR